MLKFLAFGVLMVVGVSYVLHHSHPENNLLTPPFASTDAEAGELCRKVEDEFKIEHCKNLERKTVFRFIICRKPAGLRIGIVWEGVGLKLSPCDSPILDVSVDRKGKNFYIQIKRTFVVVYLSWVICMKLLSLVIFKYLGFILKVVKVVAAK